MKQDEKRIYFENLEGIGDLYLEHVFEEYELLPIVFLCSDISGKLYLCLCCDMRHGLHWIVSKCDAEVLKSLFENNIDIATALKAGKEVFVLHKDKKSELAVCRKSAEQVDPLDYPEDGVYLDLEEDEISELEDRYFNNFCHSSAFISFNYDLSVYPFMIYETKSLLKESDLVSYDSVAKLKENCENASFGDVIIDAA